MVKILRDFPYSVSGTDRFQALAGQDTDQLESAIPAALIPGLTQAGYLASVLIAPEDASKLAGEAALSGDLAGRVDSTAHVELDANRARANISTGLLGAPEAAAILDAHRVTPNSDPAVLNRAAAEAAAAGNGVVTPVSVVTGKPGDASKAQPDPLAPVRSKAVDAVAGKKAFKPTASGPAT